MIHCSFPKKKFILILALISSVTKHLQSQQTALYETFNNCSSQLPAGWTAYSVNGSQVWDCSSTGYDSSAIQMNGYANGNYYSNEDWLISPKLNISSYFKPVLRFMSRSKYPGPTMQLFYSLNYSGSGDPNNANWISLAYSFPVVNSDQWDQSELDLSTIKSSAFHLAYKYSSSTSSASYWRLDEVEINDSLGNNLINLGQTTVGTPGIIRSFQFIKDMNGGNYTLQCHAPFELSSDSINFSSTINISSLVAAVPYTVFVRINPTVAGKTYRDNIRFIANGETEAQFIHILGSSLADSSTLLIASWNMRWFGHPSFCNCDTALARNNAAKFLKSLKADIYCLQEVVSLNEFNAVVSEMGQQYTGIVSPFSSLASSPASGNYNSGQKLAYIFNTQKIQNMGTFGLLKSTYPSDTMPNYCFSSGRFPFVMKSVFHFGNQTDTLFLVDLHAKAYGTFSDYQKRVCEAQEMKDSLGALFPNKNILIIGDYNDYLEGSSVSGQTQSPYSILLNSGYSGISLPSLYPDQSTFVGSSNHLIDNIVASSSMHGHYIDSSYSILKMIERLITNYASTTSDHYPILSYWQWGGPNALVEIPPYRNNYSITNPSTNTLSIHASVEYPYMVSICDFSGRKIFQEELPTRGNCSLQIPGLPSGVYLVQLFDERGKTSLKWIVEK